MHLNFTLGATLFPTSVVGRVLAFLWLAACLLVLGFGYFQQHIHDMPVAFVWFMIFLAFPCGLVVSAIVGFISAEITSRLGVAYHPFFDLIPLWIASVITGYVQWFVLLPKISKWVRHVRT